MTPKDVEEVMADLKNKKCEGFDRILSSCDIIEIN